MNKMTIRDVAWAGKRALVRCDFNVPLDESRRITDDMRIRAAVPTIQLALDRGATEIYALHLHRPTAEPPKKRLRGVAEHINQAVSTMLRLQADHDLHLAETARRVRLHYLPLWTDDPIEPIDFSHSTTLIEQGYAAAERLLKRGDVAALLDEHSSGRRWWRGWGFLGNSQPSHNQMNNA